MVIVPRWFTGFLIGPSPWLPDGPGLGFIGRPGAPNAVRTPKGQETVARDGPMSPGRIGGSSRKLRVCYGKWAIYRSLTVMKHSDFHSKLWVYRITWRMVGMNWVCPNMKELQSFLAIFIGSHDVQQRFFFLTQSRMWGWVEWSILGSVGPLVPTIRWGMLCWSWGWLMVIEHEDEKRELPCAKRGWTWLKTQHDALSIIEACLIFLELPGLHWLLLVHGVAWFMDDKVPGMAPGKGSILLVPPKLPCHGEACPKQEGSGSPPTPLPLKLYLERPPPECKTSSGGLPNL